MQHTAKDILGVKVDFGLTTSDVMSIIKDNYLTDGGSHYICTTNPEFVMAAQKDTLFRDVINAADLSVPDGNGVLFAGTYLDILSHIPKNMCFCPNAFFAGVKLGVMSLFTDVPIGSVVSGVELTDKICELSNDTGASIFLLGGWPRDARGKPVATPNYDFASLAAAKLKEKYPNINIIGATSQFLPTKEYDRKTLTFIKKCMDKKSIQTLDFVIVAYTQGAQDRWIARNIKNIPARVGIGVGSTFDYITGLYASAPDNYKHKRLEWLFRLFTYPWRWRRVLTAFPLFPLKVFFHAVKY